VLKICFFCSVVYRVESFLNTIIFSKVKAVSDQGLLGLGAGIKELRSLTDLSLDFGYFNQNFWSSLQINFAKFLRLIGRTIYG
jgi:hypothetical protein